MNYLMLSVYYFGQAVATRDAMAKALYGTLFDWIVLQVNHALAVKQSTVKEVLGAKLKSNIFKKI